MHSSHRFTGFREILTLENNKLFGFALLLMIAPLWFGRYLPLVDLPQHAAQIAALREIWSDNPMFTSVFEVNWFTPYLLGYLLLYGLHLVFPVTIAAKILVSFALLSTPVLTGILLREAGGDSRWRWLAIPSAFGFAFYWGFLSFLVAVPVALLFLIQTVRFAEAPTLRRSISIACFSVALFFCHAMALGFISLIAVAYVACRNYRDVRTLIVRLVPFTAALPVIIAWILFTHEREVSVQNDPIVYGMFVERLIELFAQPAGADYVINPLQNVVVMLAVLLVPGVAGGTLSRRPERWVPFALGLLMFCVLPRFALSTAYIFHRLGIFLVPLWLLAWEPAGEPRARKWDWSVMIVVLIWALGNVGRFAGFAGEAKSFERVIAQIEPGRRVGALVHEPFSRHFMRPVYLHFVAWYQAERAGIVDFNSAYFLPQMVRYKQRGAGIRINEFVSWKPLAFRWERHGGETYDYFVVKAPVDDPSKDIFKDKASAVKLVARDGLWWLYRNEERRPEGSPPSRRITEEEKRRWTEEERVGR